jgi:iron(III) transport system substrate-binding protein
VRHCLPALENSSYYMLRRSFVEKLPVLFSGLFLILFVNGCAGRNTGEVILYCAQDQVFAEPILADFTKETGIKVRAIFDSEAVKSVGMANRLLAERDRPQCDVFWGNEELRTRQLAVSGVWRETNGWTTFGHRSRRLVVNTNRLALADAPRSFLDLTNAAWRGKVAIAYPLFGTTATHFLALRQKWGDAGWKAWCQAFAANKPFLVDGNSVVVKLVGKGEALVGITDSDDIAGGQQEGLPIAPLPMSADTLLIPNTVAVVRDAPHAAAAQQLFDYLQRSEVLRRLIAGSSLEDDAILARTETLRPDWASLVKEVEPATTTLREIFLR